MSLPLHCVITYVILASVSGVSVDKESIPGVRPMYSPSHSGAHAWSQHKDDDANQGIMRKESSVALDIARPAEAAFSIHNAEHVTPHWGARPEMPEIASATRNGLIAVEERKAKQPHTFTPGEKALLAGACIVPVWTAGMGDYICSEGYSAKLTVRVGGVDEALMEHGSTCTVKCASSIHSPDPETMTCNKHVWTVSAGSAVSEVACTVSRVALAFAALCVMLCCGGCAYYVQTARNGPKAWGQGPGMHHGAYGNPYPSHGPPGHGPQGYQSQHPQYGHGGPQPGGPQYGHGAPHGAAPGQQAPAGYPQ